jgi:hypothetical protein
VAINKHHYLSSTHSLIQNKEHPVKGKGEEEKPKTVVDEDKMKKFKKKAISKAEVEKSLLDRSEKAGLVKK